jgi:hypothetical protein
MIARRCRAPCRPPDPILTGTQLASEVRLASLASNSPPSIVPTPSPRRAQLCCRRRQAERLAAEFVGRDEGDFHSVVCRELRVTSPTNVLIASGLRNTWRSALKPCSAIAFIRIGRLCQRYARSQRQKSLRSRDRRIARQAQRTSEKSKNKIVSAARSLISTTSCGPRSPSIIHF